MDYRQPALLLAAVATMAIAYASPPKPPITPLPVPITPTDMCGEPLETLLPDYPLAALKKAQPGWVLVEFSVATDGTTSGPKVIDSSPAKLFDKSALQAVKRAKFAPSETERGVCRRLVEFSIGRWAE